MKKEVQNSATKTIIQVVFIYWFLESFLFCYLNWIRCIKFMMHSKQFNQEYYVTYKIYVTNIYAYTNLNSLKSSIQKFNILHKSLDTLMSYNIYFYENLIENSLTCLLFIKQEYVYKQYLR